MLNADKGYAIYLLVVCTRRRHICTKLRANAQQFHAKCLLQSPQHRMRAATRNGECGLNIGTRSLTKLVTISKYVVIFKLIFRSYGFYLYTITLGICVLVV